ncbi:MAG TPA: circadian clock protein KaiC [Methanosarcinales archaeon]|nr:circadian clock protein KaiC [Methanosarcinales archaeon]
MKIFQEKVSIKSIENRVPTGIQGFDELCGGGLVRNRTYLISGTSGSGKTIFALQYIYNGIVEFDENGIIIATEERPDQLRENAMGFGWDLAALEEENKLAIVDACSTKIGLKSHEKYVDIRPFDIRYMLDQIIMIKREINAKRAVLDSTTSIGFHLQDPSKIRIELLKLSTTLEILGLTTMMTCEIVDENTISRFGVEHFVTEGAIVLYYKRAESMRERVRSIEVYKMRGTEHDRGIHPYYITPSGIEIHPHEEVYH